MIIKLKLLKRLFDRIRLTNFNPISRIHIPHKTIWNMVKVILCVDNKLLLGFNIFETSYNTLTLEYYDKNNNMICVFDVDEKIFSVAFRNDGLNGWYTDLIDDEIFSVKEIKKQLKKFKNE